MTKLGCEKYLCREKVCLSTAGDALTHAQHRSKPVLWRMWVCVQGRWIYKMSQVLSSGWSFKFPFHESDKGQEGSVYSLWNTLPINIDANQTTSIVHFFHERLRSRWWNISTSNWFTAYGWEFGNPSWGL